MSGATSSKALAPSNTVEANHAPCVLGPMIGVLPSRHSPSKKVQVEDGAAFQRIAFGMAETPCLANPVCPFGQYAGRVAANFCALANSTLPKDYRHVQRPIA